MKYSFRLLIVIVMIVGLGVARSQAAAGTLRYAGLESCYPVGSSIAAFTLTAQAAEAGGYQITHAVALNGGPPSAATTVFSGTLAAGESHTATIDGGTAALPGTYTLIGRFSRMLSGTLTLVAETTATIFVESPCRQEPTPTAAPQPTVTAGPESTIPPNVLWTQRAAPSRGAEAGSIVTLTVRGWNAGAGGTSDALLRYNPQHLRLLDARPAREDDWVRERDDAAGTVRIALGYLAPDTATSMDLRFLVLDSDTDTVLRLIRDDGADRANPIFLRLGAFSDGPLRLGMSEHNAALSVTGRGYKPGERVSLWINPQQGAPRSIEGDFWASADPDGSVSLSIPAPDTTDVSLVVYGQTSQVTGVVDLATLDQTAPTKQQRKGKPSAASRSKPLAQGKYASMAD
ncbi:MAG TPA: hypothetical protein VD886_15540 [Herpetosiphonaceae bacterium]|nr:hypothetical protein [Herpetosiphonaceae bacterium]